MNRVEITKITPVDRGNLKAFVDVKTGAVETRGWRVVQQREQRAWVSVPQNQVGDRYFSQVVIHSESLKAEIRTAVLKAYEAELERA